jgi:hypothetical protein
MKRYESTEAIVIIVIDKTISSFYQTDDVKLQQTDSLHLLVERKRRINK